MDHKCGDYGLRNSIDQYFFEFEKEEYTGTLQDGQKEEEGFEDSELEGKFISWACLLFQYCHFSIEPIETNNDLSQDSLWFCQ